DGVGGVAEPVEDGEEFGGGEQVAQHERVGLFGGFVAVDVVAFGFQCPVQAAYSAVAVPVEFGQVGVAGELADDAVVEVDAHAAGDVGPAGGFAGADVGAGGGDLQGALQQPDGHDVGVGVVVQAGSVGAGVAGLVFVGAHDAADLVAAGGGVEHGQRGEEAGDLDEHLGAPVGHGAGGQVVVPDVVGDGQADVALQVGGVGQPAAGVGVEVEGLGLLAAVAAALPGEHGAVVAGGAGGGAGLAEAAPAVAQRAAGDVGEAQVEPGQDEQFVPEDVSAVGLAVQAAGGDSGVQVGGVRGEGLQQVEDVQVDGLGDGGFADVQAGVFPQPVPGGGVAGQQLVEAGREAGVAQGGGEGVVDGV